MRRVICMLVLGALSGANVTPVLARGPIGGGTIKVNVSDALAINATDPVKIKLKDGETIEAKSVTVVQGSNKAGEATIEVTPLGGGKEKLGFNGQLIPSASSLTYTMTTTLANGTVIGPEGPTIVPVTGSFSGSALLENSTISNVNFSFSTFGKSFDFLGGLADTGDFSILPDPNGHFTLTSLTISPGFPSIGSTGTFTATEDVILNFPNIQVNGHPFMGQELLAGSFSVSVPEPSGLLLLGISTSTMIGCACYRRRQRGR
jgi:hypothetical protein